MNETTKQGIVALKRGDEARARELLRRAVEEDPGDVKAWLWLSGAVASDQERVTCLKRVLELDPDNVGAMRGLAKLLSEESVSLQVGPRGSRQSEELETTGADSSSPGPDKAVVRSGEGPKLDASHQEGAGDRHFNVRPSVIPIVVASFLAVVLFGALLAFLNIGFSSDSVAIGIANFTLLIMAGVLGLRILFILIGRLFTRYTLTSRHLVVRRGILSRSRKTIPIDRIQDVAVSQSLIERPFGIGDVVVESAGERGGVVLTDLPHFGQYHDTILRAMDAQGGRD